MGPRLEHSAASCVVCVCYKLLEMATFVELRSLAYFLHFS